MDRPAGRSIHRDRFTSWRTKTRCTAEAGTHVSAQACRAQLPLLMHHHMPAGPAPGSDRHTRVGASDAWGRRAFIAVTAATTCARSGDVHRLRAAAAVHPSSKCDTTGVGPQGSTGLTAHDSVLGCVRCLTAAPHSPKGQLTQRMSTTSQAATRLEIMAATSGWSVSSPGCHPARQHEQRPSGRRSSHARYPRDRGGWVAGVGTSHRPEPATWV